MTREQISEFLKKTYGDFFVLHSLGIGLHDEDTRVRLDWAEDGTLISFLPSGGETRPLTSESLEEIEALMQGAIVIGMLNLSLLENEGADR